MNHGETIARSNAKYAAEEKSLADVKSFIFDGVRLKRRFWRNRNVEVILEKKLENGSGTQPAERSPVISYGIVYH